MSSQPVRPFSGFSRSLVGRIPRLTRPRVVLPVVTPRRGAVSLPSDGGDPVFDPRRPFHWLGIEKDWETYDDPLTDLLVSLRPSDLATHILVVGRTGSGKTGAIVHLLGQDILLKHGIIVLDLRGDLVASTIKLCAGRVDPSKVAIFDLRDESPSVGFSPLFGAGPEYVRALAFLAAIEAEHESLGVQLAETLRNCALLLAECHAPITHLESILYDETYRRSQLERVKNVSVRDFWLRYSDMSKEKQAVLAMPVLNKISMLLATPSLKAIFGSTSPIDLGRHLNTPGSITLISLAVDQLSGAGRMFGNLLLSAICREIFARVDLDDSERCPVRLYVDEFENFNGKEFESFLAEGRRFKLSLVLSHQVLAQLTPKMRSLVLNNVGAKLVFATGREDSVILSKDLTGDANELDLTSLPVGEAFLWRRSEDLVHLEVNRPLVSHTGKLSVSEKAYVAKIRAHWQSTVQPGVSDGAPMTTPTAKPKKTAPTHAPRLEEWL